jgi:uncharacterized lipoprotein YddW (UPF0748 family)
MKRAFVLLTPLVILCVSAFLVSRQKAAPISLNSLLPMHRGVKPNASSATGVNASPTLRKFNQEARALWVVRFTLTSPEAVRASVQRAKENGFTDLVVQVRGRGDAFYNSQWEPRAEELMGQPVEFDPLALMIQEAHAQGLRVHAWLNAYLVANVGKLPDLQQHIIYQHPDWLMVPRSLAAQLYRMDPKSPEYLAKLRDYMRANRQTIEGLYASPAHPDVKEHLRRVWLDVLEKYDVDGLHYDYVRYPNYNFDYSRKSLERFRAELEPKLDEAERQKYAAFAAKNPLIYATAFPARYAQFQREQVTDLVESIYHAVKARKPDVAVSAAVFPDAGEGYRSRYQDWKVWLRHGALDIVCPMAYTPDTDVFKKQMAQALNMSAGHPVWGGIGSWRQPVDSTLEKIKAARDLGAQGFILFSYDSAVQFSALNPQKDYLERLKSGLAVSTN